MPHGLSEDRLSIRPLRFAKGSAALPIFRKNTSSGAAQATPGPHHYGALREGASRSASSRRRQLAARQCRVGVLSGHPHPLGMRRLTLIVISSRAVSKPPATGCCPSGQVVIAPAVSPGGTMAAGP